MPDSGDHTFRGAMRYGTFYPTQYLIAIVTDQAQADHATAALQHAGFAEVDVFTSQEMLDRYNARMDSRTLPQRVGALFSSDEKLFQQDYLEQMRAGKLMLTVHVPDATQVRQVQQLLAEQQVSMMRYYDAGDVIELSV